MLIKALAAIMTVLVSTSSAFALTITGVAEVLDSDVLRVGEYRVYLLGVESIEQRQICTVRGQSWECWPPAVRMLQTIVSEGDITCEVVSGPDLVDQVIARCSVNGEDVASRYVRAGFAITIPTETEDYEDELIAAQDEGIGLWQGTFTPPSIWRVINRVPSNRPTFNPIAPSP